MKYNNLCEDPFEFIKKTKQRYRHGLTVIAPDFNTRPLIAEDLLNPEIDLGECDNPLVLALVASRDPMVTMSMAAAARFSPMTVDHRLLSRVFSMVGEVTRHTDVRQCVDVMVQKNFHTQGIVCLRTHVEKQIEDKRQFYRDQIKDNLAHLIDGSISPSYFVDQFFIAMNQLNLKTGSYTKMIVDFLLSPRFRPRVKFLMVENLYQMPRDVRMQVIMDITNAPKNGHNEAIRDELICILQEESHLLSEPANQNQWLRLTDESILTASEQILYAH